MLPDSLTGVSARWGQPLDGASFIFLPFPTVKDIRQAHRRLFLEGYRQTAHLLRRERGQCRLSPDRQDQHLRRNLERVIKLRQVTPALLQPSDGRISPQERCNTYAAGRNDEMLEGLILYTRRTQSPSPDGIPEALRARAARLAHERGDTGRGASLLTSPGVTPRSAATFEVLRNEHSGEYPRGILQEREEAVKYASGALLRWNRRYSCGG